MSNRLDYEGGREPAEPAPYVVLEMKVRLYPSCPPEACYALRLAGALSMSFPWGREPPLAQSRHRGTLRLGKRSGPKGFTLRWHIRRCDTDRLWLSYGVEPDEAVRFLRWLRERQLHSLWSVRDGTHLERVLDGWLDEPEGRDLPDAVLVDAVRGEPE